MTQLQEEDEEDWSDCPPFVFCTGPSKEEVEMLQVHCVEKIVRSTRRWSKDWKQYIQMMDNYFDQFFTY